MDKKTFQYYEGLGISCVGCGDDKIAVTSWEGYRVSPANEKDFDKFVRKGATKIGLICGQISKGLECIDFDTKHNPDPQFWLRVWEDICDYYDGNPSKLVLVETPTKGYHIWYRSHDIPPSRKIASRPATEEELRERPKQKTYCFIETRGEGGYAIAPPSEGYKIIMGGFDALAEISREERDDLISICESYNEIPVEVASVKNVGNHSYKDTPWDEYNADPENPFIDVLIEAGWQQVGTKSGRIFFKRPGSENKYSANFHQEKRIFYVFTSSTEFEPGHGYTPFSVFKILRHGGDSFAAIKAAREMGYGKRWSQQENQLIRKVAFELEEGVMFNDIISSLLELSSMPEQMQKKILVAAETVNLSRRGVFWQQGSRGGLSINKVNFVQFLTNVSENKPWRLVLLVENEFSTIYRITMVNESKRTIKEVVLKNIKDKVFEWIDHFDFSDFTVTPVDIKNLVIGVTDSVWQQMIDAIPVTLISEMNFLRDSKNESYHFFKNNIVIVTKEGVSFKPYNAGDNEAYVWENKINNRSISPVTITEEAMAECAFYRFILRIAGAGDRNDSQHLYNIARESIELFDRITSFMSIIGYLCNNFKDPSMPYSIIIAEDTPDDGKGGGTGKGLFMKCINKVRNTVTIDGKNWTPDKSFAFQRITLDTDIVSIEDADAYFEFKKLYNIITEGVEIEKKNKDSFHVEYEKSPKIVVTTNYDLLDNSVHATRRVKKLLLHRWFNVHRTPESELGGSFFYDWDQKQWDLFYAFIFECIRFFMKEGIVQAEETKNSIEKSVKLRAGKHGEDFYAFMVDLMESNPELEFDERKKELWETFLNDSSLTTRDVSLKQFTSWVVFFCQKYGITCEEFIERSQNNGIRLRQQYLKFKRPVEAAPF